MHSFAFSRDETLTLEVSLATDEPLVKLSNDDAFYAPMHYIVRYEFAPPQRDSACVCVWAGTDLVGNGLSDPQLRYVLSLSTPWPHPEDGLADRIQDDGMACLLDTLLSNSTPLPGPIAHILLEPSVVSQLTELRREYGEDE